jgi:hypothetical protein
MGVVEKGGADRVDGIPDTPPYLWSDYHSLHFCAIHEEVFPAILPDSEPGCRGTGQERR